MTALQLYKFIKSNEIEWHRNPSKDDVYVFIPAYLLKDFCKLVGYNWFSDYPVKCVVTGDGDVVFDMKDICDYHDIEFAEVFDPSEEA